MVKLELSTLYSQNGKDGNSLLVQQTFIKQCFSQGSLMSQAL